MGGYLMPAVGTKGAARLGHSQSYRYSVDANIQERTDACPDRSGPKEKDQIACRIRVKHTRTKQEIDFYFPSRSEISAARLHGALVSRLNSLSKIQLNSKSDGLLGSQILPSLDLFRPTVPIRQVQLRIYDYYRFY